MHIYDNKFVMITEPKTIHFNLTKKTDNRLKYETDSIIRHNGFLDEQRIKIKIDQLLFKYKYRNDILEHRKP